jgi:hypothetical protein
MPHLLCTLAFLVFYPLGLLTPHLCFFSNLLGLVRKAGMPKMSLDYLQGVVPFEEFASITLLISIIMAPNTFFVYSPLLIGAILSASI